LTIGVHVPPAFTFSETNDIIKANATTKQTRQAVASVLLFRPTGSATRELQGFPFIGFCGIRTSRIFSTEVAKQFSTPMLFPSGGIALKRSLRFVVSVARTDAADARSIGQVARLWSYVMAL
jgi:hypothetical protein